MHMMNKGGNKWMISVRELNVVQGWFVGLHLLRRPSLQGEHFIVNQQLFLPSPFYILCYLFYLFSPLLDAWIRDQVTTNVDDMKKVPLIDSNGIPDILLNGPCLNFVCMRTVKIGSITYCSRRNQTHYK